RCWLHTRWQHSTIRQQCVRVLLFFNATATTEIYTLSLHDALPIYPRTRRRHPPELVGGGPENVPGAWRTGVPEHVPHHRPGQPRSEEHTSELQSLRHLVCRLLLEKKKN